jgi:hypothetical protein
MSRYCAFGVLRRLPFWRTRQRSPSECTADTHDWYTSHPCACRTIHFMTQTGHHGEGMLALGMALAIAANTAATVRCLVLQRRRVFTA